MAAHIAHHAAPLPRRIPKPRVMRAGVLFRRTRQEHWPHCVDDWGELRALRLHGLHVQLVFEIDVRQFGVFDQFDEPARLGQIAPQRLFADHAGQLGAGTRGVDDLFDHFDAREVRREDGDHVDVRRHLLDARIHAPLAQSMLADVFGQGFRRSPRDEPGHLDAAHLCQCAQLKRGNEPAADDPIAQRSHAVVSVEKMQDDWSRYCTTRWGR